MKAAEELLRQNPDVTAIFALNDKMALGAMKKMNELGLRVPQDVAVVGFDDIPQASFAIPGLTPFTNRFMKSVNSPVNAWSS